VRTQKVTFGVDLETVLCDFFKMQATGPLREAQQVQVQLWSDIGWRVEERYMYEHYQEYKLSGGYWTCIISLHMSPTGCMPQTS
jgi:hypothetical protein